MINYQFCGIERYADKIVLIFNYVNDYPEFYLTSDGYNGLVFSFYTRQLIEIQVQSNWAVNCNWLRHLLKYEPLAKDDFSRISRMLNPEDSTAIKYIREHAFEIDPWFRQQAVLKGLLSPFFLAINCRSQFERKFGKKQIDRYDCD